jgi:LysM repeat protein
MKHLLPVLVVVLVLAGALVVPASAAHSSPAVTYVVQPGDTLASIGRQFCTTWQEIYNLNRATIGPNPNVLEPGTVLQVPNRCGGQPPSCSAVDHGPTQHARGVIQGNIYTVAFGDTAFSVSRRFGLTVDQLAAANGLTNPNRIYGGQTLIIPGLGSCPPPPPPPPGKPFVTIISPAPGSLLPPTFTVTGSGGGLFEGALVVRAVNSAGQVLAEKPATLQGSDVGAGGSGTYSVQLTVNVSQNTAGKVVAYATSPKDGSVSASAGVAVTFTPGGASQPFITIGSPAPGAQLPATFTVSGTGGGLFEGGLVVRAQTNAGQVLAEKPATLQGANVGAGGAGTYSVQLAVNVSQNTAGKIIAFAKSPKDGSTVTSAAVAVTFTPGGASKPFITIGSPAPGARLPATFTVSGTGGGLYEGGLVVLAQTKSGQTLAQKPATLQGSNVSAGGAGTYSVQLTVNVTQDTAGKIVAYATAPSGSGYLARAEVAVTFTSSAQAYKDYAPGECKIQGKPGAPFYAYPGGPQTGYFGSGGSFNALRGAKASDGIWYQINTEPGAGVPSVWVPAGSTSSASPGCAF